MKDERQKIKEKREINSNFNVPSPSEAVSEWRFGFRIGYLAAGRGRDGPNWLSLAELYSYYRSLNHRN